MIKNNTRRQWRELSQARYKHKEAPLYLQDKRNQKLIHDMKKLESTWMQIKADTKDIRKTITQSIFTRSGSQRLLKRDLSNKFKLHNYMKAMLNDIVGDKDEDKRFSKNKSMKVLNGQCARRNRWKENGRFNDNATLSKEEKNSKERKIVNAKSMKNFMNKTLPYNEINMPFRANEDTSEKLMKNVLELHKSLYQGQKKELNPNKKCKELIFTSIMDNKSPALQFSERGISIPESVKGRPKKFIFNENLPISKDNYALNKLPKEHTCLTKQLVDGIGSVKVKKSVNVPSSEMVKKIIADLAMSQLYKLKSNTILKYKANN